MGRIQKRRRDTEPLWLRLWGDVFLFEEKIDTNQQSDNMGNRERTRKL